ncbi:MAG TPA: hypothetical protein VH375_02745, partial [Rhodanobacteraceae bacterium]
KRYGEANTNTAKAELWLGEWNLRAGNLDAAAEHLAEIEASKASFSPLLQAQRETLAAGIAAARKDREDEFAARKLAWDVMSQAKSFGIEHPLTAEFAIAYAAALDDAGRKDEARAIATPAIPIVEASFAEDAPVRKQLSRWR